MKFRSVILVFALLSAPGLIMAGSVSAESDGFPVLSGFSFIRIFDTTVSEEPARDVILYDYYSDDLRVQCQAVYPDVRPGDGYPALILCHGGISGVSDRMREKACELADDGYLVVMPSYRGEDGSQGEIEVAAGEVNDVLACLYLLRNSDLVDPSRIAIIGTSHGALIAALAASCEPDIPAVVCAYGVMDIVGWWYYLQESDQYEEDALSRRIYGGGPLDQPDEFALRSALRVACDIVPPMLIIQGSTDSLVPPDQAEALVQAFDACGKQNYTYNIYSGVGHGFLWWDYSDTVPGSSATERAWDDLLDFINQCWEEY